MKPILWFVTTMGLLGGCALAPSAPAPAGIGRVANLVIGGGMLHCSSMSVAPSPLCTAPWSDILRSDPAFAGVREQDVSFGPVPARVFRYQITAPALRAFEALPERLVPQAERQRVAALLAPQVGAGSLDAARFHALLEGSSGAVLAAASEIFVERQPVAARARQLRSVVYMANTDSASIYRAIVAAAAAASGKARPIVGVVTASADNPYNDHDIYVTALQSAGAEVVWLPLDGGLRRALDAGDCAHLAIDYSVYATIGTGRQYLHMDQVFPDLDALRRQACANGGAALDRELERIDGIVFTGGNQARHLDALVGRGGSSPQLKIIQRRHAAGQLVVAGSSAGNSVQGGGTWRGRPVPMIAGGDSDAALARGWDLAGGPEQDLVGRKASYYPAGGLPLFQFGPLDSHFSQRGREGRLARLVADSGMDYGFGVDENTALVVGRANADGSTSMGVLGAGGVWVIDVRGARSAVQGGAGFSLRGARMHYLHAGDTLSIDREGQLTVALRVGANAAAASQAKAVTGARPRLSSVIEDMERRGGQHGQTTLGAFSYKVARAAGARTVWGKRGQLSYAGLGLEIAPCSGGCGAP